MKIHKDIIVFNLLMKENNIQKVYAHLLEDNGMFIAIHEHDFEDIGPSMLFSEYKSGTFITSIPLTKAMLELAKTRDEIIDLMEKFYKNLVLPEINKHYDNFSKIIKSKKVINDLPPKLKSKCLMK